MTTIDTRYCPSCGSPTEGMAFCGECGTALTAAPTAPPTLHPVAQQVQTQAPPIVTAAPAQESPTKSGRTKYIVLGVIGTIAVLLVLGAIAGAAEGKHTITGSITLYDSDAYDYYYDDGDSCSGETGYGDIDEGTDVKIKDSSGDLIGSSSLESGIIDDGTCVFEFTVSDVADASYYSVEVSYRGDLSYSKSEMEDKDWDVDLTLGDE
jgi:hypothetical protein